MEATEVTSIPKSVIFQIFQTSLAAVSPARLFHNAVTLDQQNQVVFSNGNESVKFPLTNVKINILAFGKASVVMTNAFLEKVTKISPVEEHFERGFVLAPKGMRDSLTKLQPESLGTITAYQTRDKLLFLEGADGNVPDEAAVKNTTTALDFVRKLSPPVDGTVSLLVMLISGGGSSLLCRPRPPVTLTDKQFIIQQLARAGATIQELNCVRREISLVKNGELLKIIPPGVQTIALIVSDVVGDDLSTIASGPTFRPTDTDQTSPINVLKKFALWPDKVPETVQTLLQQKNSAFETETNTDGEFANCVNLIIGSNSLALAAAEQAVQNLIPDAITCILTNELTGDANKAGQLFADLAAFFIDDGRHSHERLASTLYWRKLQAILQKRQDLCVSTGSRRTPLSILAGGETTVIVRGTGRGGRNQQMVLQFAHYLQTSEHCKEVWSKSNCDVSFLSGGTDGQDGPTDAAGAMYSYPAYAMDENELQFAEECLNDNDSYNFWKQFRQGACHVNTGFTGTNVMDVQILLIH